MPEAKPKVKGWRAVTSANPGMVFDELSIAGLKARGIDFEAVFSGAPEKWISLPHSVANAFKMSTVLLWFALALILGASE
jgi:hypothetical protein